MGAQGSIVGAFSGEEDGSVVSSYATGAASAGMFSTMGGFVGRNYGISLRHDYSIGKVARSKESYSGGFAGVDYTSGGVRDSYWDTKTSDQKNGTGNRGNEPGLKGQTTAQFQSGLPAGFSSKVWAEDSQINNGFPYLKFNPPPN